MLLALLGSEELCEVWWNSPNKAFEGYKPREWNQEEVWSYLMGHMQR